MNLHRRLYASDTRHRVPKPPSPYDEPAVGDRLDPVDNLPGRAADQRARELLRSIGDGQLRATCRPMSALASAEIVGLETSILVDATIQNPIQNPIQSPAEPGDRPLPPAPEDSARAVMQGIEDGMTVRVLNRWLLDHAVQQLDPWATRVRRPPRDPLMVSVALDPRFIVDPEFLTIVKDTVRARGAQPQQLLLSVQADPGFDDRWASLQRLKSHGVMVALEDVALGTARIDILRRYAFDVVRVSASAIDEAAAQNGGGAALRNLVRLAHNLGCRVVADGIDERNKLDVCRWAGCDLITGAVVTPPVLLG